MTLLRPSVASAAVNQNLCRAVLHCLRGCRLPCAACAAGCSRLQAVRLWPTTAIESGTMHLQRKWLSVACASEMAHLCLLLHRLMTPRSRSVAHRSHRSGGKPIAREASTSLKRQVLAVAPDMVHIMAFVA